MKLKKTFSKEEMEIFEPSEKIGIVTTINSEGLPHMSLITSIQASKEDQLILGQFSYGLSKKFMQKNPNVGFAIITLDKKIWKGKAKWTHLMQEGPEYEMYNEQPMFRYNSYFGINTVHYLDLIGTTEGSPLPMGQIIKSSLLTLFAKGGAKTNVKERILKPFTKKLFSKLDTLSFLSYIGKDGFPVIIPVIQCFAADSRRLVFNPGVYKDELSEIPVGNDIAIFGLTMKMQNSLIRGKFRGFKRYRGIKLGAVDINWVYNSLPPIHGQIYPEVQLKPVTEF